MNRVPSGLPAAKEQTRLQETQAVTILGESTPNDREVTGKLIAKVLGSELVAFNLMPNFLQRSFCTKESILTTAVICAWRACRIRRGVPISTDSQT